MRLLFLTQELPYPPIGGAAVRIWSLLRALTPEHRVELLSFGDPEKPVPEPLRRVCSSVAVVSRKPRGRLSRFAAYVAGQIQSAPWMVQEWTDQTMLRLVAERARDADVVIAELLGMSQYLLNVEDPLRVYDAHNVESAILGQQAVQARSAFRRWHAAREEGRVRRYEHKICSDADLVVAVTGADALNLFHLAPGAIVRPVPIAVVVEEYPVLWEPEESPRLCFFGDMAWLPNVDAARYLCQEVLPLIARAGDHPEVVIAGRRPAPAVRALAAPRVRVTGEVADMAEVLQGDTIVVVPLRSGGGMRVKILESMAWGLPVVSTTLGCTGIDHGGTIVEANGTAFLADEIGKLLRDEKRRRQLSVDARARVVQRYGHQKSGHDLIEAIKEAWL